MCGRVVQASPPDILGLRIVEGLEDRDPRLRDGSPVGETPRHGNVPPRYNGAPLQELWVIRRDARTGEASLDLLAWGLKPAGFEVPPKPAPINARSESVARSRLFARTYAKRRCIVPVDGFYEWRMIEGAKLREPFAIAMADRRPFGLAGLWENWKDPATGEWLRTFCILTTTANETVGMLHDRMPVILALEDYGRWLGDESDPRDLMKPFTAAPMVAWPVSPRVNSYRNDDPGLLEAVVS